MNASPVLAVFVSPHGFGHAARSCAVMEAIREKTPAVRFEIFTTVSEAFFQEALGRGAYGYHRLVTDIGLVQKTPFAADLPATAAALRQFLTAAQEQTPTVAERLHRLGCRAVLCDISPLGIEVDRTAGLPSVLVENFTWDWIYEGYTDRFPDIGFLGAALGRIFSEADLHIQAEPVCRRTAADLTVEPVGRKIRTDRNRVREQLGLSAGRPMVLISLGGVVGKPSTVDRLARRPDLFFVIANAGVSGRLESNVLGMEAFSGIYHPDLVAAADALVGKAGYSTVAEVCRAGVPFGYLERTDFRESDILVQFIRRRLGSLPLAQDRFDAGSWLQQIDALLCRPRRKVPADGADQIAAALLERFSFLSDTAAGEEPRCPGERQRRGR